MSERPENESGIAPLSLLIGNVSRGFLPQIFPSVQIFQKEMVNMFTVWSTCWQTGRMYFYFYAYMINYSYEVITNENKIMYQEES